MDNLARKARVEREQQFDALTQKIIDSGWDMDRLYNIARHPEIKSRLFKTFGWTIELTDDCESMDVLWISIINHECGDETSFTSLDILIEECSAHSPDELQEEIDKFHALQKWLSDDIAVAKFIRDYSYNFDIIVKAVADRGFHPERRIPR